MAATFRLKPLKLPKVPKLRGVRFKMPRTRLNTKGLQRFPRSRVGR